MTEKAPRPKPPTTEQSEEFQTFERGLRKVLSVTYHRFIPFLENQYRKVAGSIYRLHRKLSRVFEYSKSTTRNVSEHLHHLTEAKKQKEEQDQ